MAFDKQRTARFQISLAPSGGTLCSKALIQSYVVVLHVSRDLFYIYLSGGGSLIVSYPSGPCSELLALGVVPKYLKQHHVLQVSVLIPPCKLCIEASIYLIFIRAKIKFLSLVCIFPSE